jgi:cytochrome c
MEPIPHLHLKLNGMFRYSSRWIFVAAGLFLLLSAAADSRAQNARVLIFSKTKGYRHEAIPFGIGLIRKIGQEKAFDVDTSTNAAVFNDNDLKKYKAVIFNSTTGDVLDSAQQSAFERYIHAGGGYVGIHAAADTEYSWPWYGRLMGAFFDSHPGNPNIRTAAIDVTDKKHPATALLPARWERKDEWYNYRSFDPDIKVLANLDETSYEGGKNGTKHPIIWYHEFEGGRAFYTGLGHTNESYSEPAFIAMLSGGISYAMGR